MPTPSILIRRLPPLHLQRPQRDMVRLGNLLLHRGNVSRAAGMPDDQLDEDAHQFLHLLKVVFFRGAGCLPQSCKRVQAGRVQARPLQQQGREGPVVARAWLGGDIVSAPVLVRVLAVAAAGVGRWSSVGPAVAPVEPSRGRAVAPGWLASAADACLSLAAVSLLLALMVAVEVRAAIRTFGAGNGPIDIKVIVQNQRHRDARACNRTPLVWRLGGLFEQQLQQPVLLFAGVVGQVQQSEEAGLFELGHGRLRLEPKPSPAYLIILPAAATCITSTSSIAAPKAVEATATLHLPRSPDPARRHRLQAL